MLRKLIPAIALLCMLLWLCWPQKVLAQDVTDTPQPGTATEVVTDPSLSPATLSDGILLPQEEARLVGVVDVSGTASSAWVLSFSYKDNPTDTWFLLAQSSEPVSNGVFATWNTNSVTDGNYVLRLQINAQDGLRDFTVSVFVNNYSSVETVAPPTPTQTLTLMPVPTQTLMPNQLSSPQLEPVSTLPVWPISLPQLPPNPAVLDPKDIFVNFGKGVLAVVVIFGFAGFALSLRRK